MGYSIRTATYRYTRWERWNESILPPKLRQRPESTNSASLVSHRPEAHDSPLNPRSLFWAVGQGELLAEELYNQTANVGRHQLTGEFERVNLASQPAVEPLKRVLFTALATRQWPVAKVVASTWQ